MARPSPPLLLFVVWGYMFLYCSLLSCEVFIVSERVEGVRFMRGLLFGLLWCAPVWGILGVVCVVWR